MTELEAFEVVANELASGERHAGLWAKCFSECSGDLQLTEARYVKKRAKMVLTEAAELERLLAAENAAREQAHKERQRAEAARLAENWQANHLKLGRLKNEVNLMPHGMPNDLELLEKVRSDFEELIAENSNDSEFVYSAKASLAHIEKLLKYRKEDARFIEEAKEQLKRGDVKGMKKTLKELSPYRFGDLEYPNKTKNYSAWVLAILFLSIFISFIVILKVFIIQ